MLHEKLNHYKIFDPQAIHSVLLLCFNLKKSYLEMSGSSSVFMFIGFRKEVKFSIHVCKW